MKKLLLIPNWNCGLPIYQPSEFRRDTSVLMPNCKLSIGGSSFHYFSLCFVQHVWNEATIIWVPELFIVYCFYMQTDKLNVTLHNISWHFGPKMTRSHISMKTSTINELLVTGLNYCGFYGAFVISPPRRLHTGSVCGIYHLLWASRGVELGIELQTKVHTKVHNHGEGTY